MNKVINAIKNFLKKKHEIRVYLPVDGPEYEINIKCLKNKETDKNVIEYQSKGPGGGGGKSTVYE